MALLSDDILFEVTDPKGRTVRCTLRCWQYHILNARPWMRDWDERVIATISNPDVGIYYDADRSNRQVYYRMIRNPARYLKVVVEFSEDGTGEVITAFPTDSPKDGEYLA